MSIGDDIKLAIDKNLSAEVGAALRQRLKQAEDNESALTKAEAELVVLRRIDKTQRQLDREQVEFTTRRIAVEKQAADLIHREAMLALREEHAKERVGEMRQVVRDVFSNNRYKYRESGSVPVGVAQAAGPSAYQGSAMAMTAPVDRTVEGEG